ncbi:MAG: acyl-CoA dehydrogenase, partial [Porticoccaceae bacterium]|nr:acyl-CoA dehydrogenase [Porticoccaceae bacterium]
MDLGISDKLKPILEEVTNFIDLEILPLEQEYHAEVEKGDRWAYTERQTEILESLKSKAKAKNLWNFFLTHFEGGHGLNTVEYAYIAEQTGRSHLAPEVFNCAAPDTGNMEVLARYCNEEQKETWLKPLLAGEIRSAYAMTEPQVASSDATNIAMSCVADGDEWVLNGEKIWISGAGDPRCKIMIVMVNTNPDAPRHSRHSQVLVPFDTPGVKN